MTTKFHYMLSRAQDPKASERDQLLNAYRNYLRLTAQVWLPDQLAAKLDPSDLVQETLLKAHRRFEQFRGASEEEFLVWLRRILSRSLADFIRHHRAAGRDVTREVLLGHSASRSGDVMANLVADGGTSPSGHASRRELSVLLADELSQMPAHYRQVILLRSIKELPWKEVAQQMSREIGTVRALWVRALTDLRDRMSKYL